MKLTTAKLMPETLKLAKEMADRRGMYLYRYLDELVKADQRESEHYREISDKLKDFKLKKGTHA